MKKCKKLIVALAVTAQVLAGCGSAGNAEETSEAAGTAVAETETAEETADTPETEESVTDADASEAEEAEDTGDGVQGELMPDPTNLSYLEEIQIADFYGDGAQYPVYAPKGGEVTDGYFYYDDHGITFTASVYGCEYPEYLSEMMQMFLDETVDFQVKDWRNDPSCMEVGVGELLERGNDRYLFLTAKMKDVYDTPYQRTKLFYMSARDDAAYVFWDMEVREFAKDEETLPFIKEVGRCYGIHLGELAMEDGEWASQDAQREADQQDVYEPEEGEPVLEKVEGYQYLGMMDMGFCLDEENFTCPILAPMGWNTSAKEDRVSTTIHGIYVRIAGDYTSSLQNYQRMTQEAADSDFKYRSDPEEENRNVRVSELMPMQGQEAGVYYVVEYEEKEWNGEEYHKRADVNFCIQVKEKYFIFGDIYLKSVDYDSKTNDLIKELETAYGLDLSEWYAQEDMQ